MIGHVFPLYFFGNLLKQILEMFLSDVVNNLFVNCCTVLNEDYQVLLTMYAWKFYLDLFLQWHSYVF